MKLVFKDHNLHVKMFTYYWCAYNIRNHNKEMDNFFMYLLSQSSLTTIKEILSNAIYKEAISDVKYIRKTN